MKHALPGCFALALLVAAGCGNRPQNEATPQRAAGPRTLSSFDRPGAGDKTVPPGAIHFEQADLGQVLALYADVSGRSIIRAGNLPDVKLTFSNQGAMTHVEVLRALDTVLAAQNIATVLLGAQYVKVVPASAAAAEAGPVIELPADQLPDSASFVIYIVKLRKITANQAISSIQPFAKLPNSIVAVNVGGGRHPSAGANLSKLPASLLGMSDGSVLILRDYASNVKRMLQVIDALEQR